MLDIGLYFFYVLLAVCVAAAVIFPIVNAVKTPKVLVRSLIGIGSMLALFGIGYALSNSNVSRGLLISPAGAKLISAGLITFYIVLVTAALAVVYSEISKSLK